MKKILSICLSAVMIFSIATVFTGCSSSSSDSSEQVEINVFNWGEYIHPDIRTMFQEETGIKVNYTTFSTTEEMYAKIKSGGGVYDVIIPSDYMISRMIEEDMLEPLNHDNIPNYGKLDSQFQSTDFDENDKYSIPYMWGTVGLIYNADMVDEPVDSWNIMWNEKYKGQILMFDNSRDALGIALKRLGYSYNTTDENQLKEAADELKAQKSLVQAYVMDQIFDKMINNEAVIGAYYAGDFLTMKEENPSLEFVYPKEGSNLFIDAMCIPKGAPHKDEAEAFINFMCRPDIAALNADEICYGTPVTEARDLIDPDLAASEIAYPSDEVLKNCETYVNVPDDIKALYDDLWLEIVSQ